MKVLGIVGWSGSGKTTLIEALLPLLRARDVSVSTVKHTHHGFDMDRPGKDTFRHREAGAYEVLVASSQRWALLHEVVGPEPALPELLARMQPVDLVLVEGFKATPLRSSRSTARCCASRRSGGRSRTWRRWPPTPRWRPATAPCSP